MVSCVLRELSADDISIGSFANAAYQASGTVVVIDVFRAFTTAAIALKNGAARIIMVDDLDTARDLRARGIGAVCIGERGGLKPPGFDYGNSPVDLAAKRFDGETLIQTTSNGTRGILAARNATSLYAGSLVTADATAMVVAGASKDKVTLVAMGEHERYRADEDEICALYLRALLLGRNPDSVALRRSISTLSDRTRRDAMNDEDIDACLQIGTVPFAIRVNIENGLCVATAEPPAHNEGNPVWTLGP